MIDFTVPGKPVAKERPRLSKYGIAYTPKKTQIAEANIADGFKRLDLPGLEGPICISIEFMYAPSKSWTKKKKEAALMGQEQKTSRPDLDNLIKTVLDGLNGLAWYDDSQVVIIEAKKIYGPENHTRVRIENI